MSIRPVGKTLALDVGNTSHSAATFGSDTSDYVSKAAMLNTGTTIVYLTLSADTTNGAPAAVIPTDGVLGGVIVLPASMTAPVVFVTPRQPCSVAAIGSGAGPAKVYITPCEEE